MQIGTQLMLIFLYMKNGFKSDNKNIKRNCLNAVIVTNIRLYCCTIEADWFQNYYLWLSVQFYISILFVFFLPSNTLFSGVLYQLVYVQTQTIVGMLPFHNDSSIQSSIQCYEWFICHCSIFLRSFSLGRDFSDDFFHL